MAAEDSVTRTTVMCLGVSIACIRCILPMFVFEIIYKYYPVTPLTRAVVWQDHSFPAIRQSRHQLFPLQSHRSSLPARIGRIVSRMCPVRMCGSEGRSQLTVSCYMGQVPSGRLMPFLL